MRTTLAAFFLASGLLTLAAIAAFGALEIATAALLMLAAAALGQLVGRLAFARLSAYREGAVVATLALATLLAALPAAQAIG
jgi:hypothetical protein